ncbi:High-affinity choline uptake protein BetT, partial [Pseudomonas sp. FEN]
WNTMVSGLPAMRPVGPTSILRPPSLASQVQVLCLTRKPMTTSAWKSAMATSTHSSTRCV